MTETQILHHQEQMEAIRRDFTALWNGKLQPRLIAMKGRVTLSELGCHMDMAWQAYREAFAHFQKRK